MKFLTVAVVFSCAAIFACEAVQVIPLEWVPHDGPRTRTFYTPQGTISITSQQGGDYTGPITIGNSNMRVVLDTGSSNLAVADQSFGVLSQWYNTATGTNTGQSISVQYGSGSWSGYVYSDTVQFGGSTSNGVQFGVIEQQSTFFSTSQYSGILGLAFQQIAQNNIPPLLKTMGVSVFSLQLCRGAGSSSGNMVLGGVDGSFYSGSITYTPLTPQYFSTPGYYTITVQSAKIGSSTITSSSFMPIVDSGTNSLVLDYSYFSTVQNAIANVWGTTPQSYQSYSNVPVSSLPDIEFTFTTTDYGSYTLRVPASEYFVDIGNGQRLFAVSGASNMNILGTPMLNNYYAVFDKGAEKVGFAPIANCPSQLDASQMNAQDGDSSSASDAGVRTPVVIAAAVGSVVAVVAIAAIIVVLRRRSGEQKHVELQETTTA